MGSKNSKKSKNSKAVRDPLRSPLFLGEWMDELGISDEEMAESLGCDRVTVTRYRNQQHRLNPMKIARISTRLGIKPIQLWSHPDRPSVDAILADVDDKICKRAAEIVGLFLNTDT